MPAEVKNIPILPFEQRMELARQHRVTTPDVAEAKLLRLSQMELKNFFYGCQDEAKTFLQCLPMDIGVHSTYQQACRSFCQVLGAQAGVSILPPPQAEAAALRRRMEEFSRRGQTCGPFVKDLTDAIAALAETCIRESGTRTGVRYLDGPPRYLLWMSVRDWFGAAGRLTGNQGLLNGAPLQSLDPEEDLPLWEWLEERVKVYRQSFDRKVSTEAAMDLWQALVVPFSLLAAADNGPTPDANPLDRFRPISPT